MMQWHENVVQVRSGFQDPREIAARSGAIRSVAFADLEDCDFERLPHPQAPKAEPGESAATEAGTRPANGAHSPGSATSPAQEPAARGTLGTVDGTPFIFDLEKLLETRLLIQATSGGGKSYLLRKLLEETHDSVLQIIVDVEGEFSTLMDQFGYRYAGAEGESHVAADPETAGELAREALRSGRSLLCDLFHLDPDDRIAFVAQLALGLMNAPKDLWRKCLVVIDEAHIFAPDKALKLPSAKPLIALATQGRKRGFCCVLATQRLSKLHKDAAAEMLNKFVGKTTLDRDLKRAADEIGMPSARAHRLRSLTAGEFFAYGPALLERPQVVTIGPVITEHGSKVTRVQRPEGVTDVDAQAWLADSQTDVKSATPPLQPKRRGRRKGSKNKPKVEAEAVTPAAPEIRNVSALEQDLTRLDALLAMATDLAGTIRTRLNNQ